MPKLKLKTGVFFVFATITLACGVKQSSNGGETGLKDTTLKELNADTTKTNGAPEVNHAEAKRIVEEIRSRPQNVTGDFSEFKAFLNGLNKYSLYSIARSEHYVKLLLPAVKAEYKDSTYLYFFSNFYRIANNQSDSLYIKFPRTIKKLESGKTDPDTENFNEYLDLFGLNLLMSEGTYYLDVKADYFSGIFAGKVSDALSEYLNLRSRELNEGFSEDAGLTISFERDYERMLAWESFLKRYPNSLVSSQAKYYFETYLETLLTGMDNSRVFDDNEKLIPEIKDLYESIVASDSKGKSTEIIKGYYDLLRQNNLKHSEKLEKYLKEQGLNSMLGIQPHAR